jgi:hypothetical protein
LRRCPVFRPLLPKVRPFTRFDQVRRFTQVTIHSIFYRPAHDRIRIQILEGTF